jgi:hypothetical protein
MALTWLSGGGRMVCIGSETKCHHLQRNDDYENRGARPRVRVGRRLVARIVEGGVLSNTC